MLIMVFTLPILSLSKQRCYWVLLIFRHLCGRNEVLCDHRLVWWGGKVRVEDNTWLGYFMKNIPQGTELRWLLESKFAPGYQSTFSTLVLFSKPAQVVCSTIYYQQQQAYFSMSLTSRYTIRMTYNVPAAGPGWYDVIICICILICPAHGT